MANRRIFKEFCLSVGPFIIFLSTPGVFATEKIEGKTTSTQKSLIKIPTKKATKKIAQQCVAAPSLQPYILDPTISAAMGTKTKLSADKTHGNRAKMTLQGNVQIISASESVKADKIIYDEKANRLSMSGNVIISNKDTVIQAESGFKQIRGDYAEVEESKYYFPGRNARGSAKNITMENKTTYKLKRTTYTTCSPQSNVWQLKASSLKLDQVKGRGVAKNVVLKIKKIPVMYLPVITFPIDDRRQSGFLVPSIGSSTRSGSDVSIPYYWNISPNQDATITSRLLGKRGYQMSNEYRYLHENSRGTLGLEYLPNDRKFKDNRNFFYFKQNGKLSEYWSTSVNINSASDPSYLKDLGSSLSITSATQLERRIDLQYTRRQWAVLTRIQNYQPLVGVAESYQRLPQVLLMGNFHSQKNPKVFYHTYAEAVQFEHDDNSKVTGLRLDLKPGISYQVFNHPGFYMTPKVSYRYTEYQLENRGPGANSLSREMPIASIDAGMFFDRQFRFRKTGFMQTLEPRLFYLRVPRRDQDNLPVFDTSQLEFDINQLFRENRFSGADRQADANQLTTAITSRFINEETGLEKLRMTLGQITYFDDRTVTLNNTNPLNNNTIETDNRSDAVAEISWTPRTTQRFTARTQWNLDDSSTKVSLLEYQYRRDKRHLLNVAYRFREDSIDQTDVSGVWGLSTRWNAIGRWNYSLRNKTTLEGLAGIEYNSCCWALRLIGRTYIRNFNSEKENSVHLQFVMKGLSKVGTQIGSLFKSSIIGYEDTLQ